MLPTWSVTDVHENFEARSFLAAKERAGADVDRLISLFDEHDIRATDHRSATPDDGTAADAVILEYNRVAADLDVLGAYVYASVSTDSRNAAAQAELSEIEPIESRLRPLLARLAGLGRVVRPRRTRRGQRRRPPSTSDRSVGSPNGPATRCPRSRNTCMPSCRPPGPAHGADSSAR